MVTFDNFRFSVQFFLIPLLGVTKLFTKETQKKSWPKKSFQPEFTKGNTKGIPAKNLFRPEESRLAMGGYLSGARLSKFWNIITSFLKHDFRDLFANYEFLSKGNP